MLRECRAVREARRHDGRLDARQDRRPGQRTPAVFLDRDLHERVLHPQGWPQPLRPDVPGRRHGPRRRHHHAPRRRPVLHDDDDRRCGGRPRLARGMEPDRVARAGRALYVSVTDQWAATAIVGPAVARAPRTGSHPTSTWRPSAFPFLTMRETTVGGVAARVFRISFSGELAYEVNVPTWYGRWRCGTPFDAAGARSRDHAVRHGGDARPARREGLRDRRPGDRRHRHAARPRPGLDGLEAQVVHRLAIAATAGDARRPTDASWSACSRSTPTSCCPKGAPLPARANGVGPAGTAGHVTSSYRSAALGRTFAHGAARRRPRADRWRRRSSRSTAARSAPPSPRPSSTTRRTCAVMADVRCTLARRSPLGATSDEAPSRSPRAAASRSASGRSSPRSCLRMPPTRTAIAVVEPRLGFRRPPNRLVSTKAAGMSPRDLDGPRRVAHRRWRRSRATLESAARRGRRTLRRHGRRRLGAPDAARAPRAACPRRARVGCSIDLHPRVVPRRHGGADPARPGRRHHRPWRPEDIWHVAVRASFARYLVDWLQDALVGIEGAGT